MNLDTDIDDPQMILPMGYEEIVPPDTEDSPDLRLGDLIAKTAKVTLKDTMRVILALDAVAAQLKSDAVGIMASVKYDPCRPTAQQIAACERAYYAMKTTVHPRDVKDDEELYRRGVIHERLSLIKDLA